MKTIEFIKMDIQNFKGIKNLHIDFTKDTKLKGKNGVGKTTVADAIWWVLFGKDSQGRTKFAIRPQDEQGNDIHKVDIEVELLLSVNGEEKLFGRKSSEKWSVRRGTGEEVFQGNETTLTVNQSIVKTKEFSDELDLVLNEDDFKLLSNPMHFMNNLDDKQRREVLMELAGNEEDIENELKQRPEFFNLVEEWNTDLNKNKSFNQFLNFLKDKSKTDKDTLKSIPDQIHALESTINDIGSEEELNNLLLGYRSEIDRIDNQLNKDIEEPEWVKEDLNKVSNLMDSYSTLEIELNQEYNQKQQDLKNQENILQNKLTDLNRESKLRDISIKTQDLKVLNNKRESKLAEYKEVKNKEFIAPEVTTKCHACGQELQDVNVEEHINHAKEHFEKEKQEQLNSIIETGKQIAEEIKFVEQEIDKLNLEQKSIDNEIERVKLSLEKLPKVVEKETDVRLEEWSKEIEELKNKVSEFRKNNSVDNSGLINKKNSYMSMIGDVQNKLGQLQQQKNTKNAIEELLKKEKELKLNKIKYEVLINDALDFENEKNRAFERNLSTQFNNIQWRLFENQVNGGFRNVCYPMLDGTPYSDQSTGEKIFTGVDIIKTFQSVKGISVPVIIDNKESLTLDLGLDSQTVSMYVDETLNELQVM